MDILEVDGNYIFPCYSLGDYEVTLKFGYYNLSGQKSVDPIIRARSLYRTYGDTGAVRINVGNKKVRDIGWSDLEFYRSGEYGPCIIRSIDDLIGVKDLGDFDASDSDIFSLL